MKRKKNTRQKRKVLNQRYKILIKQAWDNDTILRRFQNMELQLMQCASLSQLLATLLEDSKKQFDLDTVTLILLDADFEIQRLLTHAGVNITTTFPGLIFSEKTTFTQPFDATLTPKLGPFIAEQHSTLFQNAAPPIKSIALLPLIQNDGIIGSFNLGDRDPERFKSTAATDFLQHLSAVISTCIDMTILRDKVKNIGLMDALTEINNRCFFDQRLPEEIARSQRTQKPLSCLFINVDHFKQFNDNHGHAGGDLVLKQVAGMIREELRTTDVVSRYGGEEFVALLVETEATKAMQVAERIRQRIQNNPTVFEDKTMQVTVSIGVADYQGRVDNAMPSDGQEQTLITAADHALYQAKNSGRNRVVANSSASDQGLNTDIEINPGL